MKVGIISAIINLVLMAVIDALMYIFIKDWTNTMICSVIMIDLSFVLNMCAFVFVPNHKNSYIFQASTSVLTSILVVIEIVLMVVGVFTENILGEPYIMVAEIVIFILFVLLFITNTIANKHTAETADVNDEGISRVKDISSCLNQAFNRAQNPQVKRQIENAYDSSRSIFSYKKELEDYDVKLLNLANEIADNATSDDESKVSDLCRRFTELVSERQNKAKQLQN